MCKERDIKVLYGKVIERSVDILHIYVNVF